MKVIGCLIFLVVVCSGARLPTFSASGNIVSWVRDYGYPIEEHNVTTSDGYILSLFRIPPTSTRNNEDGTNPNRGDMQKRPLLLMHNFMSSCEDYVYGGPIHGLAYFMADQGYDVYLGNVRGSMYGSRHTRLDPQKDSAFWKFCWNEIGMKDLPAIIDEVMRISGQDQIDYIGHMEGVTSFLVMASQMQDYNTKVNRAIALGPMALMNHATHPMLKMISDHITDKSWLMKNLGMNSFHPSELLTEDVKNNCMEMVPSSMKDMCDNYYFLYNGYNSNKFNETTIRQVLDRVPVGGSVREILAFAHVLQQRKFVRFDDSDFMHRQQQQHDDMYEYDLSRISVPMAMIYTPNDAFSNVQDVETLMSKIPNVFSKMNMMNYNINMDLMYANGIGNDLYPQMMNLLRMQTMMQQQQRRNHMDDDRDNENDDVNRRNRLD